MGYFNRLAPLRNVTTYGDPSSIQGICRTVANIEHFWSAKFRFLHFLPASSLILEFTSSGSPHADTNTGNRLALAEHLFGSVPVLRHSEEDETRRRVALLWLRPDRPADKHRPIVELRAGYLGVSRFLKVANLCLRLRSSTTLLRKPEVPKERDSRFMTHCQTFTK